MKNQFVEVNCPICSSNNYKKIYSSIQEVSLIIGKVTINNVLCNECGFMFTNPRPDMATLKQHYEYSSSGDVYRENTVNSRHNTLTQSRLSFVNKYIDKTKEGKLLDVGCGDGFFLQCLNIPSWKKFGVEPSPASRRLFLDKAIVIYNNSIETFRKSGDRYDMITCFSALEHFYNPAEAINILHNLLEADGYLVIDVPDSTKPIPGIEEFFSLEHLSHFTKGSLSRLLSKENMRIIAFASSTPKFDNLLCIAHKSPNTINKQFKDDRDELIAAIESYKRSRKDLLDNISNKLMPLLHHWKQNNNKIAIYGAGFHTNMLMELFDMNSIIYCFFDGDPKKWHKTFKGWPIYPPTEIKHIDVQAIIISSHSFEHEILQTIAKFNDKQIPVISLYGS